jgi:outer membrane protein assembly factor BamE (lipoprotein component of BamABCDE complex)
MNCRVLFIGILMLMTSVVGCYSKMGTKIDTDALSHIEKGRTTKAQVEALLGVPTGRANNDGLEAYHYEYLGRHLPGQMYIPIVGPFIAGSSLEAQRVEIVFDKTGVVQSVNTIEKKSDFGPLEAR